MANETILTNEKIKEIFEWHIDDPEVKALSFDFARAIEQATIKTLREQTGNAIRGDSYAGVYAWLGSGTVSYHITESMVVKAIDPQSMLEQVAFHCIKQLERYDAMQSPEVQAVQKDADRYKWLKEQFKILSTDMGGNQVWVLKQPIGYGQTMDEACDNAMEQQI